MGYGVGDGSFQAAGGEAGIRLLVERFYQLMTTREVAREIRAMHPADLSVSRDKLSTFLCGWLGGPRLYQAKYGSISIPGVHAHLAVDGAARDAWLAIMAEAVAEQAWAEDFKHYLLAQLAVPAERVRAVCQGSRTEDRP